jgi:DNA invertase Pin-like site-specific DNA recombinase
MVKPTKPVDIYVRVSRVGGRERLISPEEQERSGLRLAQERGLHIGKVLTDLDESGGKLERPGLQEALSRVEAGDSGGLIVAWLDRLSRDSEHALRLVRRISEAGGVIYAPDAPSDWTTPEGELQAGIVFAFAQYVRQRARAGFERAKARAIESGIPVHTRPPVGYRTRPDRRLEPDPETAPIVREAFEMRARGEGPAAIAEFLAERGVQTSQGSSTWSKQAVYGLLKNRTYLGELHYGRDGRFVNESAHEPIVDLALYQAANKAKTSRLAPVAEKTDWLLAGLLRCEACRYAMQGTTTSRGKRIYRCTRRHAAGMCPLPARIDASRIEGMVEGLVWRHVADAEAREQPPRSDLRELEAAFEQAEAKLARWTSAEILEALGDTSEYVTEAKRLKVERDEAASRLGAARSRALPAKARRFPARRTWRGMSNRERREALGDIFDCFAIGENGLTAYVRGTAPELPRRGYKREPTLAGFPA